MFIRCGFSFARGAQRDNVVVSLPFHYAQAELEHRMWIARIAMYMLMACLLVNSVSFFGGFTMFDEALGLLHIMCHFVGGVVVSLMIVEKADYRWLWYAFGFFSALPALCELAAILSVVMLKKRRW